MLLAEEAESKVVEALHELDVQTVVSIPKLGPFDLSITNAVIYLWVSALVVFVFFFIASRRMRRSPGLLQSIAESLVRLGIVGSAAR